MHATSKVAWYKILMKVEKDLQRAPITSRMIRSQLTLRLCTGVILESEDLHRVAYNATFEHFKVQPKGEGDYADWSVEFYDKLQNSIGGGKPKMRWYFGKSQRCKSHPLTPQCQECRCSSLFPVAHYLHAGSRKMQGLLIEYRSGFREAAMNIIPQP